MKYGIVSDIHANPRAFEAALADGEAQGVQRWICCGDLTGYGSDAARCIELAREKMAATVMGNHDSACAGLEEEYWVRANPNYDMDRKQRETLTDEQMGWLRSRDYIWTDGTVACAHGNFCDPRNFPYIHERFDARHNMECRDERMLFVGHTHRPVVFATDEEGGALQLDEQDEFVIRPDWHYLVNVGSVGFPRVTGKINYVVYDTAESRLLMRSLPL